MGIWNPIAGKHDLETLVPGTSEVGLTVVEVGAAVVLLYEVVLEVIEAVVDVVNLAEHFLVVEVGPAVKV